jgi:hypothetical protein
MGKSEGKGLRGWRVTRRWGVVRGRRKVGGGVMLGRKRGKGEIAQLRRQRRWGVSGNQVNKGR